MLAEDISADKCMKKDLQKRHTRIMRDLQKRHTNTKRDLYYRADF